MRGIPRLSKEGKLPGRQSRPAGSFVSQFPMSYYSCTSPGCGDSIEYDSNQSWIKLLVTFTDF